MPADKYALHPTHCGGAVELQYAATTTRDTSLPDRYACPSCHETNPLMIPGRVLRVTEREAKGDVTLWPKIQ